MGPALGLQDPGGPHVGPRNLAIREATAELSKKYETTIILIFHIMPIIAGEENITAIYRNLAYRWPSDQITHKKKIDKLIY